MQPDEIASRFWDLVDRGVPDECWPWTGTINPRGYGTFRVEGKTRRATHVAWEIANRKPFPAGMMACHSCDNPPCVNPAHIWPGNAADNIRDASEKGRLWQNKRTHCPSGHEYAGSNLIIVKERYRVCRTCKLADAARRRARVSASRRAHLNPETRHAG